MSASPSLLALAAALLLALPGCLGGSDAPACPAAPTVLLALGEFVRLHDSRQPSDVLALVEAHGQPVLANATLPGGSTWSVAVERLSAHATNNTLWRVRFSPGPGPPPGSAELQVTTGPAGCPASATHVPFPLGVSDGEVAAPGQGVHEHVAAFFDSGELVYTSIHALDESAWPRAPGYGFFASPFAIYVYNQSASEEPAYWKQPLDGAVAGAGYVPEIVGVNANLKGLSTTATRAFAVEPDQGYAGNGLDHHPLHGKRLVFFVQLQDVVAVPCPAAAMPRCAAVAPPQV